MSKTSMEKIITTLLNLVLKPLQKVFALQLKLTTESKILFHPRKACSKILMKKNIAIVDYGLGNILSAKQSFVKASEDNKIKAAVKITNDPK